MLNDDSRVAELRARWRKGALKSTQQTLGERNEDALYVLRNNCGIEAVIRAFRSLGRFLSLNCFMQTGFVSLIRSASVKGM